MPWPDLPSFEQERIEKSNGVSTWRAIKALRDALLALRVPPLASSRVLLWETPITHADFIVWPSTPIVAVPQAPVGFRVRPIAATLRLNTLLGLYTGISTVYATVQLQDPNGDWFSVPIVNDDSLTAPITNLTATLGAAVDRIIDLPVPYVGAVEQPIGSGAHEWADIIVGTDPASTNGQPLLLGLDNNGSPTNLGGGNVANHGRISVWYSLQVLT